MNSENTGASRTNQTNQDLPTQPTTADQALLQQEWCPSVWETYTGFLDSEDKDAAGIARRYLELQHKMNSEPRNERLAAKISKRGFRVDKTLLKEAVLEILHPYQTPLPLGTLLGRLDSLGIQVSHPVLQKFCNSLSDTTSEQQCLNRFANPYKPRQFVYCSIEFQVKPQLGDKVVELVRTRSRRFGVVIDFRIYRLNGKRYPVIQTSVSQCFVDPERIIIVERFDPLVKPQKVRQPKKKAHTSAYAL